MLTRKPLLVRPQYQYRLWGGRALHEMVGRQLPDERQYGESWEIYSGNHIITDVTDTEKSETIESLCAQFPEDMLGDANDGKGFPLLVKILDAKQWLSVQVHPDDALAMELESQKRGKTECWYILDAAPGATLCLGMKPGTVDESRLERLDHTTQDHDISNNLIFQEVNKGDFVFVPAGLVHAIGPGIVLLEIQQTSDITYRLFDWNRVESDGKPRQLHLEKGLRAAKYALEPTIVRAGTIDQTQCAILIESTYFSVWHHTGPAQLSTFVGPKPLDQDAESSTARHPEIACPEVISALDIEITIVSHGGTTIVRPFSSVVLPARMGDYSVHAPFNASWLRSRAASATG